MAYLFLKAQGFSGKNVADVEINANKKEAIKSENCTISNIKKIGKDISFDYLAESLPYPLDTIARGWGSKKSQADVVKVVPFMEEMNSEILTVTGLKGQYRLLIDDEEIGTWNAADLEKGINLAAESKTPQYHNRKAIEVMDENVDKNMWLKGRRDMYSKMIYESVRDARQQEMDVLVSKIYEINKPITRKVVLRKI